MLVNLIAWVVFQVAGKLNALTSRFSIPDTGMFVVTMCFVKDSLVVTGNPYGKNTYKTKVYDDRGALLKEWEPSHALACIMSFSIHGRDYLLESCTTCEMIRGYEFPQTESKILCEGIFANAMCNGPDGTILVLHSEQKVIKQFNFSQGQFHLAEQFSMEFLDPHSLCYSDPFAILLHNDKETFTGTNLGTGEVTWQNTEIQLSSPTHVPKKLRDIVTLPDGRICIYTQKEIFAVDPKDGTVLCHLLRLKDEGIIRGVAASLNNNLQILAIAQYTEISVYQIPFQPCKTYHYLALQDII